jgi:hypothetical protein
VVAAAALAYYTIFALTPGLVLVIAVAGFLLGQDAEGQRFLGRSACSLASRARPRSRRQLGARVLRPPGGGEDRAGSDPPRRLP